MKYTKIYYIYPLNNEKRAYKNNKWNLDVFE